MKFIRLIDSPIFKKKVALFFLSIIFSYCLSPMNRLNANTSYSSFRPGKLWFDTDGNIINAHGGGVLFYDGKYYWYGEHKSENSNAALVGVTCYSSLDLYNWKFESVALPVSNNKSSPIVKGCIIERPKVIYNPKAKMFVMYFHHELSGRGYEAAYTGIAVSKNPAGPFTYLKSDRVNAGYWPINMSQSQINSKEIPEKYSKWWTPEWFSAIRDGLFVRRDFQKGQMLRDMTLFVDDDGKAYQVYSSEDNLTLQIAELSDDYLSHTGKYIRVDPAGHNEAPAIFKNNGKYFMIASGCTGWDPNEARLLVADNILGEWKRYGNPCQGKDASLTFHSQSTFILPIQGKKDQFIFMADRWRPTNPIDGRYIWLPITFESGLPVVKWYDDWTLNEFAGFLATQVAATETSGYKLLWNDEFDHEGAPNTEVWKFEKGFVRNNEDQWYQPENASCSDGVLTISARKEKKVNPNYNQETKDRRTSRQFANYTSASINTRGTKEFQYGRFEVRAKIPTAKGAWPAIWTLGKEMEWPSNGEIDIMEYYQVNDQPHILANTAWGAGKRWNAVWNSSRIPFSDFLKKDSKWADKFHVWRMDWDEDAIRLYIDDQMVNETLLKNTQNGSLGNFANPFRQPHYLLLNLAIGGDNGGKPDESAFPMNYQVDYVRVYQKTTK
ncbi:MAG: hypothetical protein H6Q14_353 [Bacteroidetes bacterium]|nr:hypothetical protein [Bacteroidota bacterium]